MKFTYETKHLILKVISDQDSLQVLDFYLRNEGDFEHFEPITAENFYTEEYHKTMLHYEYQAILKLNMIRFWIYPKDNPNLIIGTVSFRNIVRGACFASCEMGYKMDSSYRNRGLCKEALRCSIDAVFNELGLHRIEAMVLPDNAASIHLLQVLGFAKEGYLRRNVKINGEWRDHYLYALLREDYDKQKTPASEETSVLS